MVTVGTKKTMALFGRPIQKKDVGFQSGRSQWNFWRERQFLFTPKHGFIEMMIDPVPGWYFIATTISIAVFCTWSSVRIINLMKEQAIQSMDRFGHEMMNLSDKNDQDQLEEIEKLKDRILWAEKKIVKILQKNLSEEETPTL